jgi:hypothetical protein
MTLDEKLQQWFERPQVRACNWEARLFWEPADDGSPYGRLRVDAWELEVLFAALLGEKAENYAALNARVREGDRHRALPRADFIAMNARRHELPLLTRADDIATGN